LFDLVLIACCTVVGTLWSWPSEKLFEFERFFVVPVHTSVEVKESYALIRLWRAS